MRLLIFFLALHVTVTVNKDPFIFEPLDQSLISLWIAADDEDIVGCVQNGGNVTLHLTDLHCLLRASEIPHFDKDQFIRYTSTINKAMSRYIQTYDYKRMKYVAIELLFENYSLRECLTYTQYPLDDLLLLSQSYSDVNFTVRDPMMDLLEWNEFMGLVDRMVEKWNTYDCRSMEYIQDFFPSIPAKEHQLLKDKANDCLTEFLDSLNSGYSSDFEIPCDDLGNAFSDLMKIYAYEK